MPAVAPLRAAALLALALAAGACADDQGAQAVDIGSSVGDAPAAPGPGTGLVDGGAGPGPSAPATPSISCVDRPPTEAPRAPTAGLPCELLPPGFVAPR